MIHNFLNNKLKTSMKKLNIKDCANLSVRNDRIHSTLQYTIQSFVKKKLHIRKHFHIQIYMMVCVMFNVNLLKVKSLALCINRIVNNR